MCVAAVKTAIAMMEGIEPTLVSILAATKLTNTTAGIAVITAYNAALAALQNWQSGTVAQEVIELLGDFQGAVKLLPIPDVDQLFVNIILGGIITVIGIVTGNSPAPAPPAGVPVHEETQAMYAAQVIAETTAKVQVLVPSFKRSIFHSPESQYKKTWNDASAANPTLGVAKV
jgi:hypothetical protein